MKFAHLFVTALFAASSAAHGKQQEPDCSGPDRYPASVAYVLMKNAEIVRPEAVDFDHVESEMLVSQRVGRDLWRQVFRVQFPLKSGEKVKAIVVSDASTEECSMNTPEIYVISRSLGQGGDQPK